MIFGHFPNSPSLYSLKIEQCGGLKDLSSLSGTSVTNLEIKNCVALHDIAALSSMPNLKSLDLSGCSGIKDFSVIPELSNLYDLNLRGCNSIEDPEFFKSLDLASLTLPNKFFTKIRHVEKFGHLITKDYYVTDELLESSPFDSVDDLIDAYEEGTEEWEDFLRDEIGGYYILMRKMKSLGNTMTTKIGRSLNPGGRILNMKIDMRYLRKLTKAFDIIILEPILALP